MLKCTLFLDTDVREKLKAEPEFANTVAYQKAVAVAAEVLRFSCMPDTYRRPDWISDEVALFGDEDYIRRHYREAHRIECVLRFSYYDVDVYQVGQLRLVVKMYPKKMPKRKFNDIPEIADVEAVIKDGEGEVVPGCQFYYLH